MRCRVPGWGGPVVGDSDRVPGGVVTVLLVAAIGVVGVAEPPRVVVLIAGLVPVGVRGGGQLTEVVVAIRGRHAVRGGLRRQVPEEVVGIGGRVERGVSRGGLLAVIVVRRRRGVPRRVTR